MSAFDLAWALAWPPAFALICAAIRHARGKPPWASLGENWATGAKSRALRDALVRKARETAQPRRVLRPVPQGAWMEAL